MRTRATIKIKALFLLVVFSLNSILGFACSVGIDLGYNTHHHTTNAVEEPASHCNAMGGDDLVNASGTDGDANSNHANNPDSGLASNNETTPHDCCKDGVLNLTLLDKNVAGSLKVDGPAVFPMDILTGYLTGLRNHEPLGMSQPVNRSDHPLISAKKRIVIQSFQI